MQKYRILRSTCGVNDTDDKLVACDVDSGDKLITFSSEIDDKLITGDENWSYVTLTSAAKTGHK